MHVPEKNSVGHTLTPHGDGSLVANEEQAVFRKPAL
jgi:hypothetical protein